MKILFLEPVGTGLPPIGLLYLIPPLEKAGYSDKPSKLKTTMRSWPNKKKIPNDPTEHGVN